MAYATLADDLKELRHPKTWVGKYVWSQDHKVIDEIKALYQKEGKALPKTMKVTVYYNRGVFFSAIHARAIQLAIEANGYPVTGEQVKNDMDTIHDFDMDGFLPPLNLSPEDHEGGGWVKVYQVKGGKWVPASDWIQGYRDLVLRHVAEADAG